MEEPEERREENRLQSQGCFSLCCLVLIRSSEASQDFIVKPHLPGCEEGPFIKAREKSIFCLTQLTYFISLIPVNI